MTPFSIAGVQMTISASHENVTAMTSKIEHVMALFPGVEMIVFSELAPYGPLPSNCPESLVETEHTFREYARRHGVWLIPGSMFVRESGRLYHEALVMPKRGTTQGIGEPAPEKIAPPTEPGKGASIH